MTNFIDLIKIYFLPKIKDLFELLGIFIIIIGSLYSMYVYVAATIFKKNSSKSRFIHFRASLTRAITTGLEVIIISDLINTSLNVTYYTLGILLLLVIIRTIIEYFLNKDLEKIAH